MIEEIKSKMTEVIKIILEKPASKISKNDYDILSAEYCRLKMEIDAVEHGKKMTEMIANMWAK